MNEYLQYSLNQDIYYSAFRQWNVCRHSVHLGLGGFSSLVMTKVCWGLSADPLGAGRVSLEAVWGGFSHLSVCGLPTAWQSGNQTLTRGPPEQRASGQETLRSHPQAEEVGGRTGPREVC